MYMVIQLRYLNKKQQKKWYHPSPKNYTGPYRHRNNNNLFLIRLVCAGEKMRHIRSL